MRYLLLCFVFFFVFAKPLKAQETVNYTDAWFLLLNHYKFSENWQVGNEFHWRRINFMSDQLQLLIRPYVNYHANENITYTFGYTYVETEPYGAASILETIPEHNIWEQVTLNHQSNKTSFSHRFRMENRWIGAFVVEETGEALLEGYTFVNRLRYRLTIRRPLTEKLFLHLFDELWIAMNNKFANPNYDRNWIFLGIGHKIGNGGNVQVAYLHQNIRRTADIYERHPSLQVVVQYDF